MVITCVLFLCAPVPQLWTIFQSHSDFLVFMVWKSRQIAQCFYIGTRAWRDVNNFIVTSIKPDGRIWKHTQYVQYVQKCMIHFILNPLFLTIQWNTDSYWLSSPTPFFPTNANLPASCFAQHSKNSNEIHVIVIDLCSSLHVSAKTWVQLSTHPSHPSVTYCPYWKASRVPCPTIKWHCSLAPYPKLITPKNTSLFSQLWNRNYCWTATGNKHWCQGGNCRQHWVASGLIDKFKRSQPHIWLSFQISNISQFWAANKEGARSITEQLLYCEFSERNLIWLLKIA